MAKPHMLRKKPEPKDHTVGLHLHEMSRRGNSIDSESTSAVTWGWGWGWMDCKREKGSPWGKWKVLKRTVERAAPPDM